MREIINQINQLIGGYIPNLIGALAILVVGWLVALLVAAIVRGGLRRTAMDKRMAQWIVGEEGAKSVDVGKWFGRSAFYIIIIFVLVAFFQALGLTLITEPLNRLLTQVFQFTPQLIAAGLLLLIAWVLASVLRLVVSRVLGATKIDDRLGSQVGLGQERRVPLTKSLADTIYWLVLLLFLPAVLSALALEGLLAPVQGMINKILGFLPNVFTAGLILGIGWFLARIVQRIVTNLLVAIGADRLSDNVGLSPVLGTQRFSGILGLVLYVLILIPVLIAALNALALEAITQPASNMLNTLLGALPAIFAATMVVILAYVVGRVAAGLITNLLTGAGFNTILTRLGLAGEPAPGERTLSEIVGYLLLVGIMLFATIEAARQLGFVLLAELIAQFTVFAGQVILGLVIFAIGLYLGNVASRVVAGSGVGQARLLSIAARLSIVVLAGAMALRQMGLASEIINLAFGLLLGSIAVGLAIALGMGGREIAARELAQWVDSMKSKKSRG
jgi:hypothetical protein